MRVSRLIRSIKGVAKADVSYRKKAAFVYAVKRLCNKKAVKEIINKKLSAKPNKYSCKLAEMKPHKALMEVKEVKPAFRPPPFLPIVKLPSGKFGINKLRIKYPHLQPAVRLPNKKPIRLGPPPAVKIQAAPIKFAAPLRVAPVKKKSRNAAPPKRFKLPRAPFQFRVIKPTSKPAKR